MKYLLTLLLLLGVTVEMKAADVYLLTAQTINGVEGKYDVPSNHKLAPNTSYGDNVYSLKITSMPQTGFWFRIGVSGESNQMQPTVNDAPLTINDEGTQNPTSYSIESGCYGSSNAWKVSYTADKYEYLTVNVDITEGSTRRVWIEGKKKTSAGGSDEPVALSTDVEPGYYLVGNFFSEYNVGGGVNPGGDSATIDYTKHVYFKFEQQKDKSYAFSIPACLTAHAQILAVDDYDNKMVYGPGEVFKLHGAKDYTSAWPLTNGKVGTNCETTPTAKTLLGSETLAENGNYWDLMTRNDSVTDDDGMYTFSFTLDGDGNPSDWQVKHDATTRVSYILGDMEGATAQPLLDKRKSGGNTGEYSDNNVASLYFNGRNNYWCIGYVANDLSTNEQREQAIKATPDIHVTQSVNANGDNNSGTHDKLFFLGNGGSSYNTSDFRDKVRPNRKPFTLHLFGIKRVEFNPNRGDSRLAQQDDSYGMSGSILLKGGDSNNADFTIEAMSMIGDAVGGTYDAETGSWNYASKAGDMEYDANERCFSLTISTEDEKYDTPHYFRFVANHDAAQNWGETDDNVKTNTGFARYRYDGADDAHHTCMAGDANDVQFRSMAREADTDFGSESLYRKDILWNRPAGIWTIRFYPERDLDGNDISRYTITGKKVVKIPFTYRVRRFIRTYSNSVAMEPANDKVKVYAAYKYVPPTEVNDRYSKGTVYLRELHYVPANMGVVLVGEVPAGEYSDGAKLDFYLKEKTDDLLSDDNYEKLWIKAETYEAAGDKWNNYLRPTVQAVDNLGNADTDENGTIAHRYFGLGNFHSTKYYRQTQTGEDYIGFFRFTEKGRSGANKAYLSIPANANVDGGVGATYGFIDYNGQLLGNVADTNDNQSLAKMAVIFDDEDNGGTTTAVREVKMANTDADAFYTLQGVKVSRPVKGVYIHNGKKFIK